MADWPKMSLAGLGRDIAAGRADPVDIAQACLAAASGRDDIYARLTPDRALAEAVAARTRAANGTRLGPLDGVPVSWKDLFDTAGTATEAGTALLAGRVPDTDAAVLQSAGRAGLVCLGKTHLSELAFSGLGLNPVTATPPNINDPEAVPGGSSSGAAASVAFGLAPGAIGSDTGGSVRVPAAWNDLVGLKTTHGRLSLTGVVPLAAWFDTVGPLTRTVEDAALLLSAMEGTGAPDLSGASLTGAEFFVLDPYTKDAREAPGAAFEAAVSRLSSAGAKITRGAVPAVDRAFEEAGMLLPVEAYGTWKHLIETAPDKMYPPILERFRSGAAVSGPDYVAGWKSLEIARAEYLGATAGYDAVLLPTSPILPPNRARLMADHDYYVTENLLTLRNTRIGNLLGLCGLSLPTGTPSCGVMLLCPPMADLRLLRLGAAVEAALLA